MRDNNDENVELQSGSGYGKRKKSKWLKHMNVEINIGKKWCK